MSANIESERSVVFLRAVRVSWWRRTSPDHRWGISIAGCQGRSPDGQFGWELKKGCCWRGQEHRRYYLGAHCQWGITLSVRPVYRIVYAESFVRDVARLTGQKIEETRTRMTEHWRGEVPPPPLALAEREEQPS